NQFTLNENPADATFVALPPLIVLGVLILILGRAFTRLDPARLVSSFARAKPWRLGGWRVLSGLMLVIVIGNVIAFPLYSLIWRAGRVGGRAALGRPPIWSLSGLVGTLRFAAIETWDPLGMSLQCAAIAATVTTATAFALAWVGRRTTIWQMVLLVT